MKSFIALFALVAVAAGDVSHIVKNGEAGAETISQNSDVLPDQYSYGYQTSNGIQAQESGVVKNIGKDESAIEVQGANSYTSPEGVLIETKYFADENGYRAEGAHLPVAPEPLPIPEYIARAIAYIAAHPPKPEANIPGRQF